MRMTRKQFFKAGLGAVGALSGLSALGALPACGSSDNTGGTGGSGTGGSGTGGSGTGGSGTGGSGTGGSGTGGSGAGGSGGSTSTSCIDNGTTTVIQTNHGHVMTVSKADVVAGAAKDYHIQGTAPHDHVVSLTAADFAQLAQNQSVTHTSTTTAGHTHVVIVNCA